MSRDFRFITLGCLGNLILLIIRIDEFLGVKSRIALKPLMSGAARQAGEYARILGFLILASARRSGPFDSRARIKNGHRSLLNSGRRLEVAGVDPPFAAIVAARSGPGSSLSSASLASSSSLALGARTRSTPVPE